MGFPWRRRRIDRDADLDVDEEIVDEPRRRWQLTSPAAVRAVTVGLWVLVAAGAVTGSAALWLAGSSPAASTPSGVAVTATPVSARVTGFAEVYVGAFLAAGEGDDVLSRFTGEQVALAGVVPGSWFASRTATLDAVEVAAGYWEVQVAVELMRLDAGAYTPAGTRFFAVGVVERDGTLVAAGLPAMIAGPVTGESVAVEGPALAVPAVDDDVTATVERFLNAMLAGTGELDRYASAGSGLVAISPPPFDQVTVERVAVDGREDDRTVRLEARGTAGETELVLAYSLELTRRDGRWEVGRLTAAPDLEGVATASPPVPPPAGAPTNTTTG